jgi:hypothetical protein
MLSAIPLTNGTFPPRRDTTIPNPSSDITTCVRLFTVLENPESIFIVPPFICLTNRKGETMKMLSGFSSTINSLTTVVISLLGLGIVVSLLGANVPFVSGIAENITGLVQSLGDAGIVGLIAAIIILGFYK